MMLDHDSPAHFANAECTITCFACRLPWVYEMCETPHVNGGLMGLVHVLQLCLDSHDKLSLNYQFKSLKQSLI